MLQATDYQQKAVLCFVRRSNHLLLIEKLRGLGKGKVNAPGGKVEEGESFVQAAIRETQEEVHITPADLDLRAIVGFRFADGYSLYVEVFFTETFEGEAAPSPEANPFWCAIDKIPYERMWADDVLWLPGVLAGNKIVGHFDFNDDTMTSAQISLMPS